VVLEICYQLEVTYLWRVNKEVFAFIYLSVI